MPGNNSAAQVREESIITGLREGSGWAYQRAIKYYTPGMIAAARFFLDPDVAEDVVQEAWITVTKAIKTFEGRSNLSTWLHRIVVNKAKNHLRKRKREQAFQEQEMLDPAIAARFDDRGTWLTPPDAFFQNESEALAENDDLINCLDRLINHLPDQQRSAVILYELHCHSPEEVCQMLGITLSNLRVMVHRSRQKVYTLLDNWHETGEC